MNTTEDRTEQHIASCVRASRLWWVGASYARISAMLMLTNTTASCAHGARHAREPNLFARVDHGDALIVGNLRARRCLGVACLRQVSSAVVGRGRAKAGRPLSKHVKRRTASSVRGVGVGAGAKQAEHEGGPAFLRSGVERSASVLGTAPVRVRTLSKQLIERSDLATGGGLVQAL